MANDNGVPKNKVGEILADITVTNIFPPDGSKLLVNIVNNWRAEFDQADVGADWSLTQPAGSVDPNVSAVPPAGSVATDGSTGTDPISLRKKGDPKSEPFLIKDKRGNTAKSFTYNFVKREINPIEYAGEVYATAPFSGEINTSDDTQLVKINISVNENDVLATNVDLDIKPEGNLYIYDASKNEITDQKINTGAGGVATIYAANTVPGIFNVTFLGGQDQYGNQQVEGSQSIQIVIADPSGGGNLTPPYIVEMGGGSLNLDQVGSTVTVKLDDYPSGIPAFSPVVIVVNNVPVVSATLAKMAELVNTGLPIPTTLLMSDDNFIYYATYLQKSTPPNYESVPLGPFKTIGAAKNSPLSGVSRTYQEPLLAPNVTQVNRSTIAGGLPVYIDNTSGMIKTGDKIYVTGYANGTDGTDDTKSRATSPRGYPYPLVVTDENKDSLMVRLDQAQLSNFGEDSVGNKGTLLIDYYLLVNGTGPKQYSKYKSGGWPLITA